MSEEEKGFIIKDRRLFPEGDKDQEKEDDKKEPSKEQPEKQKTEEPETATTPETEQPLPEINFSTFIISLNASALVHLGVLDDPVTGKKVKSLQMGKQTIDILGMIEEKTKGNLSKDEEDILKHILYDLRMIYVKEKE